MLRAATNVRRAYSATARAASAVSVTATRGRLLQLRHLPPSVGSHCVVSKHSVPAATCVVRSMLLQTQRTQQRGFASKKTVAAQAAAAQANKDGNAGLYAFTMDKVTKRLDNGRKLFDDVTLSFFDGAKIGILGQNGAGKSSFLKILAGVDKDYDGSAKPLAGFKVGYLEQEPELDETKTVYENVMDGLKKQNDLLKRFEEITEGFSDPDADFDKLIAEQAEVQTQIEALNCWDLSHKVKLAMDALRCPPGDWEVENLSGGEKRRVALCRLLLAEPDILLLDEPTNHLDAQSVAWLETFLSKYSGLVIAITHDRCFLDNVAGYILEIEGGKCYPFKGNYAAWLNSKQERMALQERQNKSKAKLMQQEMEWMRKGHRANQGANKARVKRFENMQEEKRNELTSARIESGAMVIPTGPRLGKSTINVRNLGITVDDQKLFEGLNFSIKDGDRWGIIGPNGSGKSTLLRMLVGELEPTQGEVDVGANVMYGYNSQTREDLKEDAMVYQEICGDLEFVVVSPTHQIRSRKYVAQFNFQGNEQTKRIHQCSGGERNRIQLAKSLSKGCNVIILDEPTNDLDVDTLRALEDALADFDGAGIIVSHDRWFLNRTCTHILAFDENGQVEVFEGNYSEFEDMMKKRLGSDWTPAGSQKFKNIKM